LEYQEIVTLFLRHGASLESRTVSGNSCALVKWKRAAEFVKVLRPVTEERNAQSRLLKRNTIEQTAMDV